MEQGKSAEAFDTVSLERIAIDPPREPAQPYGPWNPGIDSTLPAEFVHLATVFSSANVSSSIIELKEINSFCGLALERLSTFKPARLALHEVLIRVMADLSVPDGEEYEDLGINFRQMTATIMGTYIAPQQAAITALFEQMKSEAADFLDRAQGQTGSHESPELPKSNPSRFPNTMMSFVSTSGASGLNRRSRRSNEPATRRWSRPPRGSLRFMAGCRTTASS
jgi:hypothetical protein